MFIFDKPHTTMAQGSSKNTETADFWIRNMNMRLKREIVNISKSEGKTYSQFCREQLIKIAAAYPESAKKYREEDDGN